MQKQSLALDNSANVVLCLSNAEELLHTFLSGKSPQTLKAYYGDWLDFVAYTKLSQTEALSSLFGHGQGAAYKLALEYRNSLTGRNLAPATINRRIAALRSLSKQAKRTGFLSWSLEVDSVKLHRYKDTRGPGNNGTSEILKAATIAPKEKACRDRALLLLMFACALRRAEVVSLNRDDVESCNTAVWVQSKGYQDRERISLPPIVQAALNDWIQIRGNIPGPLFTSVDRHSYGSRLTGNGLYKVVRTLGNKAGLSSVRPHGLRHAGITCALDMGTDIRKVQRFSRHKDIRTVLRYDDNRSDLGGLVAELVASTLALEMQE